MKFLVDAQLPRRLAWRLREAGHDALHTLDLSDGNRTADMEINDLSVDQGFVVITKMYCFRVFRVRTRPPRECGGAGRLEDVAKKAGASKEAVLWVLGLHHAVADIAAPDSDAEGATLAAARLGKRARPVKALDNDF